MHTDAVFWVKIGFLVFCFFEAYLPGVFPTYSKGCRESPKILGIANAFACGVFIAIALIHIAPEEAELWSTIMTEKGVENPFPLPYFLMFCGYTLILVVDKVLFDTHQLFDKTHGSHDPAEARIQETIKRSLAKVAQAERTGSKEDIQAELKLVDQEIKESMREYLSSADRFAARMKASLEPSTASSEKKGLLDGPDS